MLHFCTLYDRNYLSRGLALLESLTLHCPSFCLYVLCLDDETHQIMQHLPSPNLKLIPLAELERHDPELAACRHNRSRIEYYFTMSPCLPLYLLVKEGMNFICSLDSDLYFYQDPTPLFNGFESFSILITEHFHSMALFAKEHKTGVYNVSFQAFRHDDTGLACLRHWREQCLQWCYHILDEKNNRYADQKYLESWPADFPGKVRIIRPKTAGLATWNVNHFQLTLENGQLCSDGEPVVFYHFHGLKFLSKYWIANAFSWHHTRCTSVLKRHIYQPYILTLRQYDKQYQQAKDSKPTTWFSAVYAAIREKNVFFVPNNKRIFYLDFSSLHHFFGGLFSRKKSARMKQ
jgi:hypothetical protein